MTLGALIVLAVLVAGGIYLPRNSKTEARQGEAQQNPPLAAPSNAAIPNATQTTAPAETAPAATVPNSPTPDSAQPVAPATPPGPGDSSATLIPKRTPVRTLKLSPNGVATEQMPALPARSAVPQSAEANANAGETANPPLDRDELEHQIDQLSSRAAAVNSSLDRLQQQQSNAGYGLRGDMVAKQASMKTNLSRAESAMQSGDLPKAKKYADMAANDAEALEHFLGH
jgi:hypothetical protein